jgi:hypothetical protein
VYRGARVHQTKSHCFACKGKGSFKTDPRKLAAKRATARRNKQKTIQANIEAFRESNPDMFTELRNAYEVGHSNGFISSLADQLFTRGSLTDNQIAAWERGKDKLRTMQQERAAAEAAAPVVDLSPIAAMFERAAESGYKRPSYRAEGLVLSRASAHSRNPGALYVKDIETQDYLGKVVGGKFMGVRTAPANTLTQLQGIAADPTGAAVRFGQRTGVCACCGRKLTKHTSIERGIGPICADRWGL